MHFKHSHRAEWRGGLLWNGCVQQQALVEMMSLRCLLPLHTLVATVRQVVKQPPIVEGSQQVKCTRVEGLEILPLEVCCRCSTCMRSSVPGLSCGSAGWPLLSMEVSSKLLESCSNIAGSGLGSTTWLRRNLTVKAKDNASVYSVAALSVLAELLAPLLDVLYVSEKDKVVPLLTNIMAHVVPYLCNHM
ncbi:Protein dopey-2 [Chionoecetes opilio]|uniref:Protein dopey-2 n=1 Tax=Chionoecetes opilio TaxID=41210 RepID=A0A8J5CT11_CHIOP|nr:Protein dopey-2 [Chionoecetes opilio]